MYGGCAFFVCPMYVGCVDLSVYHAGLCPGGGGGEERGAFHT